LTDGGGLPRKRLFDGEITGSSIKFTVKSREAALNSSSRYEWWTHGWNAGGFLRYMAEKNIYFNGTSGFANRCITTLPSGRREGDSTAEDCRQSAFPVNQASAQQADKSL